MIISHQAWLTFAYAQNGFRFLQHIGSNTFATVVKKLHRKMEERFYVFY